MFQMGQNPLSPEVALTILKAIEQSDKCIVHTLDLSVSQRCTHYSIWLYQPRYGKNAIIAYTNRKDSGESAHHILSH